MIVWVVTSDFREKYHPQVISVRSKLADAYEDQKRYILKHNDEDYVQADKALPAREFCAKYVGLWMTSGSVLRLKVR